MGALERIAIPIASDVRESRDYLPFSVGECQLRREYAVLKLVYEHLLELDPECMGETHEKVVGHGAWRYDVLHPDCNGLGFSRTYHHRYSIRTVDLGEYERIGLLSVSDCRIFPILSAVCGCRCPLFHNITFCPVIIPLP